MSKCVKEEKNTKNIEQFKTWLTSDNILKKIEKAFYDNEKKEIADNIDRFLKELFNEKKSYTKSELDMVTDIYKRLDKNLNK